MILITGGAGYVGSHVNRALRDAGHETLILDSMELGNRFALQDTPLAAFDLRNTEKLEQLFRRYEFEAVFHFAAYSLVGESVADPLKYYANNLKGAMNLLSCMKRRGVNKLVFSSSAGVYGIPASFPVTEDAPTNPCNPYGWTKLLIEKMIEDCANAWGLSAVSLRYFSAAGANHEAGLGEWHNPETHLIPSILRRILAGEREVAIFGGDYDTVDGTCVRDYVHVTDLAAGHLAALEKMPAEGETAAFNLGSGSPYSNLEIVKACASVTGEEIKPVISDRRPGDPPVLYASNDLAGEKLGWTPVSSGLDELIGSAFEFLRTRYH
jgi:UDP-glucose 4-epimerase